MTAVGLWLRGNGNGTFSAMDASITGIKIEGEQRGALLADFITTAVDLAVSQNNGPTKLYINQGAKAGFRVVLNGPPANPDAVGAQIRVVYADAAQVHAGRFQAGSGYWSRMRQLKFSVAAKNRFALGSLARRQGADCSIGKIMYGISAWIERWTNRVMLQIRMPNAECRNAEGNPKSEARSQRRSDGALAGTIQLRRTLALTRPSPQEGKLSCRCLTRTDQ